jgi:hypothetical protein
MDFNKAQLFIDKITREFGRMKADPTDVAQVDVDVLKNYIRELYDTCLDHNTPQQPQLEVRPQKVATSVGPKTITVHEEPKKVEPVRFTPERVTNTPKPPEPSKPVEIAKPIEPPAAVFVEKPIERPAPPVKEVEPEPAPVVVQAAPTPASFKTPGTVSRKVVALFDVPEAKEISEKLARSPISDLKKGMTLNDKLQWPKVLFAGNVAAFEACVDRINQAGGYDEASEYLMENFAEANDWANAQKIEVAHAFILLVARRFGK